MELGATVPDRQRVFARRPFEYDGQDLDRGQITETSAQRNDEKLMRLGYFKPTAAKGMECGVCGGKFIDDETLGAHGDKRHQERFVNPDDAEDAEERMLNHVSPLYLDQTKAAREASAGVGG